MKNIILVIEQSPIALLKRVIVLIVFLFIWGMITHETYSGSGDEPHYMIVAQSIIFDHDLELYNNYADRGNLIYGGNLTPDLAQILRERKDGKWRPNRDLGLPLLFAPYYGASELVSRFLADHLPPKLLAQTKLNNWVLLKFMLGFGMIFLTGLLAVCLFDLFLPILEKKSPAFFLAIFFVITPPVLSHSFLFFPELLSALCAVGVYRALKCTRELKAGHYFYCGLSIGYLFLAHTRNIGVIFALIGIALYQAWESDRMGSGQKLLSLGAGLALMLGIRSGFNWYLSGKWLATSHHMITYMPERPDLVPELFIRIFGLLFDQEAGLFFYAPVYILAFAGFVVLWRRSQRVFWELFVMFAVNYALIVSFPLWNGQGWTGFWSPAARYIVSWSLFLSVPIVYLLAELKRLPALVKLIFALQMALNCFFWQFPKLLWNDGDGVSDFLIFLAHGSGWLSRCFPSWNIYSNRSLCGSVMLLIMSLAVSGYLLKPKAKEVS